MPDILDISVLLQSFFQLCIAQRKQIITKLNAALRNDLILEQIAVAYDQNAPHFEHLAARQNKQHRQHRDDQHSHRHNLRRRLFALFVSHAFPPDF